MWNYPELRNMNDENARRHCLRTARNRLVNALRWQLLIAYLIPVVVVIALTAGISIWYRFLWMLIGLQLALALFLYIHRHQFNNYLRETIKELTDCCTSCGYDLTGNDSGTCPECGTSIPPETQKAIEAGNAASSSA